MSAPLSIAPLDHAAYLRYALTLAEFAPERPTNFRVGAVLVDELSNSLLSTGYTMELPGNTHAEQCCLQKYNGFTQTPGSDNTVPSEQKLVLYTTLEPCNKRASGNTPCIETILSFRAQNMQISKVYVGTKEPEKFVGENEGSKKLEQAGVEYLHIRGLEEAILKVATAGHATS